LNHGIIKCSNKVKKRNILTIEETENADWTTPDDIKKRYSTASFLADNRVSFNIAGNKYRLIVKVNYRFHMVYIRFVGTHAEYSRIDAEVI
jgi:mRNA interferase HigB